MIQNVEEHFLDYRKTVAYNLRGAEANDTQIDIALSAYDLAVRKAIEYKGILDILVEEIIFDIGEVREKAIVSHTINRYGEVKKTLRDYNKSIEKEDR